MSASFFGGNTSNDINGRFCANKSLIYVCTFLPLAYTVTEQKHSVFLSGNWLRFAPPAFQTKPFCVFEQAQNATEFYSREAASQAKKRLRSAFGERRGVNRFNTSRLAAL